LENKYEENVLDEKKYSYRSINLLSAYYPFSGGLLTGSAPEKYIRGSS
jgi:hypothetical protein